MPFQLWCVRHHPKDANLTRLVGAGRFRRIEHCNVSPNIQIREIPVPKNHELDTTGVVVRSNIGDMHADGIADETIRAFEVGASEETRLSRRNHYGRKSRNDRPAEIELRAIRRIAP